MQKPIRTGLDESAELGHAILDSLHDHVAVLDAWGVIVAINDAWKNFALQNGVADTSGVSVGANYLEVCRQATMAGDHVAEQALIGLESVLNGTVSHFAMDYECSSPSQERWFTMTVLRQKQPGAGAVVTHSDITDRKQSEEALRRSEERLRLLTDAVPVLISYVDANQRYRFNNKAYENWFGHPREYVAGKHLSQVLGERAYQAIRPQVEAVLSGRLVSFEDFIPYRGAGRRYVKITYVPDRQDSGVRGFFALIQDLTERKQAEEEVRESRDRLSTIIAGADVGTWDWNIQAGTVDVNERFCTMLGYEPRSFGTDVQRFFDSLHPDDAEKVNRAVQAHFAGKSDFCRCDFRLRTADGSYKWIHDAGRLSARDHEGKPLRMVGIHMDLTEEKRYEAALKASEEEFRSMFELAGVGKAQADPTTGRFTRVNKKFCEITGYSEEELLAMTFRDITHPEDRERDESGVQRVLKRETDSWSIEKRYIRKDGTVLWVHVNGSLIKHKSGLSRTIANVVDITERKQSEESLKSAYKEIQDLKERLEAENVYLREEINVEHGFENIIGQSDAIKYVLYRVQQVAPADATVFIGGETGTGKGLVAGAIHQASKRRERPMVHVNCAVLPANLIESELFGREKGAFTGAQARQIGRFELADKGTIFLDEIGELPVELQAKLLRVIEAGEFERLGSPHTIKVDVRVIASTNRNLEEEIRKGRFREDLFYRLNVFPITMPPLRQRKEDIPLIVEHLVNHFSKRLGKRITSIPHAVVRTLQDYRWPGNVRELQNIIERAVIASQGPMLELAEPIQVSQGETLKVTASTGLADMERSYILKPSTQAGGR